MNKNENTKAIKVMLRDLYTFVYWSDRLRTKKEIQLKLKQKIKRQENTKKKQWTTNQQAEIGMWCHGLLTDGSGLVLVM
jgi:hypothetical protein